MAKPDRASHPEPGRRTERNHPFNREQRINRLSEVLHTSGVDAVLLSQPANIDYFTGFKGVEPQEREALVVVGADGRKDFIARQLYFGQTPNGFESVDILDGITAYAQRLREQGVTTLGIEEDNLTVAEHKQLLAADIKTKAIEPKELRQYKTEAEIDRIRESCRLGDNTFTHMLSQIKEGVSETQLRDILEQHMRSQGVSTPSFATIVAFGENAANPHHMPDETTLHEGNFITFDFGFVGRDGYQSDMTRTVFFGKPTAEHVHMYATTLKAQEAVTAYLQDTFAKNPQAQLIARDIDTIARSIIEGNGYASEHFPHGLGHGIGIETHEYPFINKRSEQKVTATMVFSNEPGIYVPGFQGVRIEDLLAIHDNGRVEVLTHSPKDLICIDSAGQQTILSEKQLLQMGTQRTA